MKQYPVAAEPQVSAWIHTKQPIHLKDLRGRVVVVVAFHVFCPLSVAHAVPQAASLRNRFPSAEVAVLGLHTAPEAGSGVALETVRTFAMRYQLPFPVGLDRPGQAPALGLTAAAWGLSATPGLLVLDRRGQVRLQHTGRAEDLPVGALVGQLLTEPRAH